VYYIKNQLDATLAVLSLLLHRASCRFTNYHTTNKCTNFMSFIFKSLWKCFKKV